MVHAMDVDSAAGTDLIDRTTCTVHKLLPHPELKTIGKKSIRHFLRKRDIYLQHAQDAQDQRNNFQPVSVVALLELDACFQGYLHCMANRKLKPPYTD